MKLFFLVLELTVEYYRKDFSIKSKFMNYFNKKIIALIALLIFALLLILGKNYIIKEAKEIVKVPFIRIQLINVAKIAIPLKNLILMRNIDDKIVLLKSSGSCIFCDLTQGNFEGNVEGHVEGHFK